MTYLNHLFGRRLRKHHRSNKSLCQCFNWYVCNSWVIMKGIGGWKSKQGLVPCSISLISCHTPGSCLEICISQTTTEANSIFIPSCGPTMCRAVVLLFPQAYTEKTSSAQGAELTVNNLQLVDIFFVLYYLCQIPL